MGWIMPPCDLRELMTPVGPHEGGVSMVGLSPSRVVTLSRENPGIRPSNELPLRCPNCLVVVKQLFLCSKSWLVFPKPLRS